MFKLKFDCEPVDLGIWRVDRQGYRATLLHLHTGTGEVFSAGEFVFVPIETLIDWLIAQEQIAFGAGFLVDGGHVYSAVAPGAMA